MARIMGDDSWNYIMLDDESWENENQKGMYRSMSNKRKKAEDANRRKKKSRALKGIREAFDEILDVLERSQIDNMEIADIFSPDKIGRFVEAALTRERYIRTREGEHVNPINPMLYCSELATAMKRGLEKNWQAMAWDVPIISRPKEGTKVVFRRKRRKAYGYELVGTEEGEVIGQASFNHPFESGQIQFETGDKAEELEQ